MLRFARKIAKKVLRRDQRPQGTRSFSQCGEDLLIDYVLRLRGITRPTYMDIGAHDPLHLSNTAIFYARGCRGINIEANPDLIQRFLLERPEDTNLNVGVAAAAGSLDFYIMADASLSTFSKEEKDSLVSHGHQLRRVEQIKVCTLQTILAEHCNGVFPDILSIDVEGMDLQILKTIDFARSAPKIICVEAAEYSPRGDGARREETIEYLKQNGYFEYANTNLNAIMVETSFWNTKELRR